MLEFVWVWLFVLLPLPWLLRLVLPAANHVGKGAIRVPFYQQLESLREQSGSIATSTLLRHLLLALVWILTVTAAANPIWIGEPEALPSSGRDLLLAVDLSESMATRDMRGDDGTQSRLAAVSDVVGEFVEQRRGDRLGLVLFGSSAYFQTPLTFDRYTVKNQLAEATTAGEYGVYLAGGATAIGDAIGLSIKKLQEEEEESRVLILLTDGANTRGSTPLEAAQVAADERIRIYTVGVGTDRHAMNIAGIGLGPTRSEIDEPTLIKVAEMTGGQYFRARDSEELAKIYAQIDLLEPLPEETYYRPRKSIFHWPLTAAVILAALGGLLQSRSGSHVVRRA